MKRHPLLYIAGALIGSASLLSFSAHSQSNSSTPVAPKGLEELQMEIRNIMAAEHIPGAGIALVAKDRILWEGGLGKANLKANTEVTADTCFRTGAISNSLVALALLKLQEDGKIDLEAKLADLAPELHIPNAWQSSHPVTVANLLEQTAGFDDVHESGIYNVGDPQDISLLDILQKLNSPLTARWPPATRMSYSNPGYGVAGYLIEKISNEPFDQYIRENILTPMGATYSDFQLTTNLNLPLLAEGLRGKFEQARTLRFLLPAPRGRFQVVGQGTCATRADVFESGQNWRDTIAETGIDPPSGISADDPRR